ncbi:hypothetical protein Tco_1021804 [Tanacetum coccineum]
MKRNVRIEGEKKEALHTLRQKPEHQSDTKVFTMTMEILLEPTLNKLLVDPYGFEDSHKDGNGGGGGGGFELLGGNSSKDFKYRRGLMGELGGVENTSALGEDSFEDMSMTLVLAIFLGEFLVDNKALEAILEKIKGGFEADLLRFLGGVRMTFGERDHDVIRKEVNVRDSNRLGGVNMPIEASEEHCIGKHHQVAFDHTCHSLCYVANGIFAKNGFLLLEVELHLGEHHLKGVENNVFPLDFAGFARRYFIENGVAHHLEDLAKIELVGKKRGVNDTSFMKETLFKILVDALFDVVETRVLMIFRNVVGGIFMVDMD